MSRCFSYPPPGYFKAGARGYSANQSIKLEKEKKNTVTEHSKDKKRNRDHKRKRDDKKERREVVYATSDKFDKEKKNDLPLSRKLQSVEEGEGSGLTEEHELPVSSGSVCYLSDGNGTSKKSPKLNHSDSASKVSRIRGNVIRIRLPVRKSVEETPGREQQCSTSGRDESMCLPGQERYCSTGAVGKDLIATSKEDSSRTQSEKTEASAGPASVKLENKVQTVESLYQSLIEDWVRPQAEFEVDDSDDQDWLFGTSKRARQGNRRCDDYHELQRTASCSSGPSACYLPEADICALPYTIPF